MAKKYRALTGLNFPATPAAVKKRKAGQELEPDEWTRVETGKTTDAIPAESISWLLKDGLIEEIKAVKKT